MKESFILCKCILFYLERESLQILSRNRTETLHMGLGQLLNNSQSSIGGGKMVIIAIDLNLRPTAWFFSI